MFNKTLIIDNDIGCARAISSSLDETIHTQIEYISSYSNINFDTASQFDLYIIRLDTQTKDIIKYLSDLDKFILVVTDDDTQEIRKEILALSVTDYIITNSKASYQMIAATAKRIENNAHKTILTVDDSKLSLMQLSMLLDTQNLNYIQCNSGEEAWEYLQKPNTKKIDLVLTDYEMPGMNGYELVQNIRTKYHIEELPVLVVSGIEDAFLISKFLKAGANDYINKPFIHEELIARITNSLSLVNMFTKIKNMSMTDHLTGIHNRVYFYEAGKSTLENARRAQQPIAIAMIDIDNFKKINDTYGHETGDKALKHLAIVVKNALRRSDVFVRFGGEEFVVLLPNCPHKQATIIMEKVRMLVEKSFITLRDDTQLKMTISIGLTSKIDTLDAMLDVADKYMYQAKHNGRNQIHSED